MPLYQQLADRIRQRIADGTLRPGQAVPSEARLVAEFKVARITARKAVQVLRDEGLIHTVQGRGSYVGPLGTPLAAPETKAAQIAAELADEIRSGRYAGEIPLPSETTLCQRYGVAKGTIRAAVALLREQGWAYTVPQRGTYATAPDRWPDPPM